MDSKYVLSVHCRLKSIQNLEGLGYHARCMHMKSSDYRGGW